MMKTYNTFLKNTENLNNFHILNKLEFIKEILNQKNINKLFCEAEAFAINKVNAKLLKNHITNKEYFNNKNNQVYNIINNLYTNKVLLLINIVNLNDLNNQNIINTAKQATNPASQYFLQANNIIEYLKTASTSHLNSGTIVLQSRTKIRNRGIILKYNKLISYNFNKTNKFYSNNIIIKNITILLNTFFKSMYCLISKPRFLISPDKITIKLFYYLNIPKYKVLKWFSIYYNKKIRHIYLKNKKDKNSFISWKLRKSILKLKSKSLYIKKLIFKLFKYNISKVYYYKFKIFCEILSKQLNKPVELELIRLHHPYHDSNILVNLLALNFKNKRKKSRVAIQKIYNKNKVKNLNDLNILNNKINNVPAFLSGLNIKIAGRLMREPIIPRITTKVYEKGAIAIGKVNFIDFAKITKKNRKGAYTIKISSAQNFF